MVSPCGSAIFKGRFLLKSCLGVGPGTPLPKNQMKEASVETLFITMCAYSIERPSPTVALEICSYAVFVFVFYFLIKYNVFHMLF